MFNTILTIDAVEAFRLPGDGGIGMSVGTLVLVVNAVLLWRYTLSCHAARHLCGGHVNALLQAPDPLPDLEDRSPRSTPATCSSPGPASSSWP